MLAGYKLISMLAQPPRPMPAPLAFRNRKGFQMATRCMMASLAANSLIWTIDVGRLSSARRAKPQAEVGRATNG
jgi:hypothetical protein